MDETTHVSLWLATQSPRRYAKLTQSLRCEVAIIGGGMVGILLANQLHREGRDVVVLEARRVLHGVTGHTTAKVSASHSAIYDHIASQFGKDEAALYANQNLEAIDWIESEAIRRGVDCDFRRRDLFLYAENADAIQDLQKEHHASHAAGMGCEWVDQLDVPFEHHGAIRYPNQAEFHPLKFLNPLLEELGERVFEDTVVAEVDEDEPTTLTTLDGLKVVADHVVVATHYPFFDPGFYYARLDPFRDYAIAFRLDGPVPSAMYVGTGEGYTYRAQPHPDGDLLIVSGGDHKVGKGGDTREHYANMDRFVRQHFPVRDTPFFWSTQDVETIDRIPFVGRISARADRVYVATGFGGWGMTNSVVASNLLTALIAGRKHPIEDLYSPLRFKPGTSAGTLWNIAKDSVQGLVGERLHAGDKRPISALAPGEANVMETDDGKVAVYRDESGAIHAVSPVCTHMGCIVEWNSAERSWDCPCHGSRFSFTGDVLHGPAIKALEAKAVAEVPREGPFTA